MTINTGMILRIVAAALGLIVLLMIENSPDAIRNNICEWDMFDNCREILTSNYVIISVKYFAWLLIIVAFGWPAVKFLIDDYHRTVIAVRPDWPSAKRDIRTDHDVTVVARDVWLLEAIYYLATGEWTIPESILSETETMNAVGDAVINVRQWAVDGNLPIWGRTGFSGPLLSIDKGYWEYYGFNFMDALKGNKKDFQTEFQSHGQPVEDGVRRTLMTSKAKIRELWPQKIKPEKGLRDSITAESVEGKALANADARDRLERLYSEGERLLERPRSMPPREWRLKIIDWFDQSERGVEKDVPSEAFMFRTACPRPKPDEKFDDCPILLKTRLAKLRLIIGRLHAKGDG